MARATASTLASARPVVSLCTPTAVMKPSPST